VIQEDEDGLPRGVRDRLNFPGRGRKKTDNIRQRPGKGIVKGQKNQTERIQDKRVKDYLSLRERLTDLLPAG